MTLDQRKQRAQLIKHAWVLVARAAGVVTGRGIVDTSTDDRKATTEMTDRPPWAVALLYPDNSVWVVRPDDEDNAERGFVSRLEFTIPFKELPPQVEDSVLMTAARVIREDMPWHDVVALGAKKIRDAIAVLPDGRYGSRGECRSCHEPVVFVRVPSGKVPPFDYSGHSHFETCPSASAWRTSESRV